MSMECLAALFSAKTIAYADDKPFGCSKKNIISSFLVFARSSSLMDFVVLAFGKTTNSSIYTFNDWAIFKLAVLLVNCF